MNKASLNYFKTTGLPWFYGKVMYGDEYLFNSLADLSNSQRDEEVLCSKDGLPQQIPFVRVEAGIISTMKYTGLNLSDARDLQMIYKICKFPFKLIKQINNAIYIQCDTIAFYDVKLPFYDDFTLFEYASMMKKLETKDSICKKNESNINKNAYPFEGFRLSWVR